MMIKILIKRQDNIGHYNRTLFYKRFLSDIYNKNLGYDKVTTLNGRVIHIDIKKYRGTQFDRLEFSKLNSIFDVWLLQTEGRPFSFIHPQVRKKIFMGQYPGISKDKFSYLMTSQFYRGWVPHFGICEKYISGLVPAITLANPYYRSGGWEVNFRPQKSYGEFEKMIHWFSDLMPGISAPGHQRIVYSEMRLNDYDLSKMRSKTAEFLKNMQAYIVLEGLIGKTGIETARWKRIIKDKYFQYRFSPKGVIRLDGSRWGQNTQGVEIRSGTKYPRVQRFIETSLAARVATNDWNDIQDTNSWVLVPKFFGDLNTNKWPYIYDISKKYDFSFSEI